MYIVDGSLNTARQGLRRVDPVELVELGGALESDAFSPAFLGLEHWDLSLCPVGRTTSAWRRAAGLHVALSWDGDASLLDLLPPLHAVRHG